MLFSHCKVSVIVIKNLASNNSRGREFHFTGFHSTLKLTGNYNSKLMVLSSGFRVALPVILDSHEMHCFSLSKSPSVLFPIFALSE